MVTLSDIFLNVLSNAAKYSYLPTIEDTTQAGQELLALSLRDLASLSAQISDLSLYSPNDNLEDTSTRNLVYLLVPYVTAEVRARIRIQDHKERAEFLSQTERYLRAFIMSLEQYEIVAPEEQELFSKSSSVPFLQRRELKIEQYKKEKDIRVKIEAVRKRRRQSVSLDGTPSDFQMIASILSSSTKADDDDDDESDDVLREATLLLLRLMYIQARNQLDSTKEELQLLGNLVSNQQEMSPQGSQSKDNRIKVNQTEDMWKLDKPQPWTGRFLDSSGKPLRPFTILPSGSSDRAQLRSQVFGPDHNLPTMTIDEYLEIERERGKMITGGGATSAAEPTSSEQLDLDAEMDGTLIGEQKQEEKRQKDEDWAMFTDANPRGAGNTMNRG